MTTPADKTHISYRNISCACINCLGENLHSVPENIKEVFEIIPLIKYVFSTVKCKAADPQSSVTEVNIDLNNDEING